MLGSRMEKARTARALCFFSPSFVQEHCFSTNRTPSADCAESADHMVARLLRVIRKVLRCLRLFHCAQERGACRLSRRLVRMRRSHEKVFQKLASIFFRHLVCASKISFYLAFWSLSIYKLSALVYMARAVYIAELRGSK